MTGRYRVKPGPLVLFLGFCLAVDLVVSAVVAHAVTGRRDGLWTALVFAAVFIAGGVASGRLARHILPTEYAETKEKP